MTRASATALLLAAVCGGCSGVSKSQYFMVYEPTSGDSAFYRVDLRTYGTGAEKFKLSTAYLPASTIDALSGKDLKVLPDAATLEDSSKQVAKDVRVNFNNKLKDLAQRGPKDPDADHSLINQYRDYYASLYAAANLNDDDFVSIGQFGGQGPYAGKKLVFFVSGQTIPLATGKVNEDVQALQKSAAAAVQAVQAARNDKYANLQDKADKASQRQKAVLDFASTHRDRSTWTAADYAQFFKLVGDAK